MKAAYFSLLMVLCAFFCAAPAYAYVGPGPGLSMLGSLFTLIGGVFVAIFMVLLYPLRLLYKRIKGRKAPLPEDKRD